MFVFPSLYEGFGLPILEAMACGTCVITSNVSSMPEAGGRAAVYVNPLDELEISLAIEEVLKSGVLRKKMIRKGFKQVKKFDWVRSAERLIRIYQDLSKEPLVDASNKMAKKIDG